MTMKPRHSSTGDRREGDTGTAAPPRYTSQTLFQGAATLEIEHEGERYTLRRTRQGKLILTK